MLVLITARVVAPAFSVWTHYRPSVQALQNLHDRQHGPFLKETIKCKKSGRESQREGESTSYWMSDYRISAKIIGWSRLLLHTQQHLNPAVCLHCHFPEQRSQRKTKCTLNAATGRHETVQECLQCANQMRNEPGLRRCWNANENKA